MKSPKEIFIPKIIPQKFSIDSAPPPGYNTNTNIVQLISSKDNKFIFGAAGDLHAASKYCRWDVRKDLYDWFINEGAVCNFDTGNWIDGEAKFNKYDIEIAGLDNQIKFLSKNHPKGLKTYAIWGDDHEGWYVQREGIDVGLYAEHIMKKENHDWNNLGFMESHVLLINRNSGKVASMRIMHPGGGSAYATSYRPQKIIESWEGGDKPSIALFGHYHKLMSMLIRNVWALQTGCQQDQTPFMRKKNIEAHIGGGLVTATQDPDTGSIVGLSYEMARYFNKEYYGGDNRWSRHGTIVLPKRSRK